MPLYYLLYSILIVKFRLKKIRYSIFLFSILASTYSVNAMEIEFAGKTDSTKAIQKKGGEKFSKGFQKSLWFLTYLNYADKVSGVFDSLCNPYEEHCGMRIRNIDIYVLEPFGTNVDSPLLKPAKPILKIGNKMQVKTREWVVKQDLFFKEGDALDPQALFDSERQLWSDQNFKDIRITIKPVDENYVDIVVAVRDRWSFRIQSSVEVNRLNIGLGFANLLGIPQTLRTFVSVNYNKNNIYALNFQYSYKNIKRSRIDLFSQYSHDKYANRYQFQADRIYANAKMKWASSVLLDFNSYLSGIGTVLVQNQPQGYIRSLKQDYWISGAIPIKKQNRFILPNARLILAYRFERTGYLSRPFLRDSRFADIFLNSYSSVGSIGISHWDFYVDKNVYLLGIKEYFPMGLSVAFIGGTTGDEELENRFYSGLYLSYGLPIKRAGFLNINTTYGGYVYKGYYDQFSWRIKLNYFTDSYKMGKAFFRQIVRLQTIMSFNRPTGREINLNGTLGFNELYTPSYRGNHSLVLRLEEDFIANFKVLGFNSSVFLFANLGFVSKYDIQPFKSIESSQFIGFGLRLRNPSLGMDLIEISLGYFPTLPRGLAPFKFGADYRNLNIPKGNALFTKDYLMLDL